jgi:RNA polymerase sigma-70 factor (ECF subfamily)
VGVVEQRDHVLAARLAAGDDDAIGEVFDRYGAFVLGVARRIAGSVSIAEEVVQEVFVGLWQNPEGFDPQRGSLRAYLGVIAHRRTVDLIRRDQRRRAREDRHELLGPGAEARAVDEMDSAALTEVVRQAIARLPEDQRRAVELAFWHGHTHREVADALGIPQGTAKSRLRLAQAKLSEWLAPLEMETV